MKKKREVRSEASIWEILVSAGWMPRDFASLLAPELIGVPMNGSSRKVKCGCGGCGSDVERGREAYWASTIDQR